MFDLEDEDTLPSSLDLGPVLTVGQLTRLVGLGSTRTTRRLLEAGGVRVLKVGRRYTVERGALEEGMPHFYEAVVARARGRSKRDW
jgi:hypothetical protein